MTNTRRRVLSVKDIRLKSIKYDLGYLYYMDDKIKNYNAVLLATSIQPRQDKGNNSVG